MDIPQWYNKKLWLTSKQSIDGKPVRSHSANYSNRRIGFNNQAMSGNWTNYLKVNNFSLPNRDREFTYRYSSKRPVKSAVNNQTLAYQSNYLVTPMSYTGKLSAINSSQPLTLHPKPMTFRERFTGSQNENKPIKTQIFNKIIQPQYVEYGQEFYSLSKKFDIVHGNINSNEEKIEDEEKFSDIEERLLDSLNISNSTPVPQNTPRFINNSSQEIIPKKSILKKSVNIICQSDIYRNSNNQILGASLKPTISSQPINRFFEIRKNLQSAPSIKREVRFDMNNNNIIEFTTND